MHVHKYVGFWTIHTVRKYNNMMFIFGDNDIKVGKGGQAIIRDEPNAFGIPTKKYPNNNDTSFYTDLEYEKNKEKINAAINHIKSNLHKFKGIVYPSSKLGTGLSQLDTKAPRTFRYLNRKIRSLLERIEEM